MKKLIVVGIVMGLLLTRAGKVEAQCPPSGGIAANPTNYSLLMPNDAAAEGAMTATMTGTVTNVTGGLPSHNLKATVGTQIQWNVASNNATNATLFVYANGTLIGQYPEPLNGSAGTWTLNSANVGDTYSMLFKVSNASGGQTSQDLVTLYIPTGSGPSIVYQDELPTNLYNKAQGSFSGTSNMACGACQQNPQACSNVTHQPSISFSLSNLTSGEVQNQSTIYGQPVNPTFNNGMSSNSLYLSVLPGDTTQDSQTDQVDCSLMGIFYNQGPTNPGGYTTKTMKTKIKVLQEGSTTAGVTRWYVESWCIDTQHTPIWEPEYIDTKGAATILISEGQYEMSYQNCKAKPGMPAWDCPPIAVTPPQPLTIGVGGTKYDCSTLINTPLPQ